MPAELHVGETIDPSAHERTGQGLVLDAADFTTHGVIVGMTGSGKTGLGVVLIEEALRAGIPTLVLDPEGDMTNLALRFPGLTTEEFAPGSRPGPTPPPPPPPGGRASGPGASTAPTSPSSTSAATSPSTRPVRRPACRWTWSARCPPRPATTRGPRPTRSTAW